MSETTNIKGSFKSCVDKFED